MYLRDLLELRLCRKSQFDPREPVRKNEKIGLDVLRVHGEVERVEIEDHASFEVGLQAVSTNVNAQISFLRFSAVNMTTDNMVQNSAGTFSL